MHCQPHIRFFKIYPIRHFIITWAVKFEQLKENVTGFKQMHIAHLRQQCHNSKFVIFQEKSLKVLKCFNFLWVQRRHNCCPAASFTNCVMTLYLLKVHLQTFLSIPITQKCQILICATLVANERYYLSGSPPVWAWPTSSSISLSSLNCRRISIALQSYRR